MMFTEPPESAGITTAVLGTKVELDTVFGVLTSIVQIAKAVVLTVLVTEIVAGPAIAGKLLEAGELLLVLASNTKAAFVWSLKLTCNAPVPIGLLYSPPLT